MAACPAATHLCIIFHDDTMQLSMAATSAECDEAGAAAVTGRGHAPLARLRCTP